MFEQIFKGSVALARQRNGPLLEERRRYLIRCADQEMSRWTLRTVGNWLLVVANSLRLSERANESIGCTEIEAAANKWASRRKRGARQFREARQRFIGIATRWLAFLDRLRPLATITLPFADRVAAFADFMRCERGLTPRTVTSRCWWLQRFLARLSPPEQALHAVTVAQVDDALVQMIKEDGYRRVTVQSLASVLRAFFRYAEQRAWCRAGLAAAITAPRVYWLEKLPAGPSWESVQQVIAAAAGNGPADRRAHALLMLVAIYALRSGEVAGLRLVDFDWERELLTVSRGKRQQPRTYPLCRSVGDAVLCYLRETRPRSACPELFLTLRAPFRPLTPTGVQSTVRKYFALSGVTSPHYGPHALRYACAMRLLDQGLSLKQIGDHLGHRFVESTRIYAKVDLAGLRAVADIDLEGLQ